jgi:protein-disulfide isomerase
MNIPIPKRPIGYRHGYCDALLQIEAFIDLECPFSKKAWDTLCAVVEAYSKSQISVTVYPIVLADHRQSWDVTKATVLIAGSDAAKFWDCLSYLYERQDEYAATAFYQQTHSDLYSLLARFAADYAEWQDGDAFIDQMNGDAIEQSVKAMIRYATQRGIWSTPTFLINSGEENQLDSAATVAKWQATIDSLLR